MQKTRAGRGQTAFEYILIITGGVLIITVVIMLLRGSSVGSQQAVNQGTGNYLNTLANSATPTRVGCAYDNPPCLRSQMCENNYCVPR